jgi:hypothetical protein
MAVPYYGRLLSRLASAELGLSARTSAWYPIWLLVLPPAFGSNSRHFWTSIAASLYEACIGPERHQHKRSSNGSCDKYFHFIPP